MFNIMQLLQSLGQGGGAANAASMMGATAGDMPIPAPGATPPPPPMSAGGPMPLPGAPPAPDPMASGPGLEPGFMAKLQGLAGGEGMTRMIPAMLPLMMGLGGGQGGAEGGMPMPPMGPMRPPGPMGGQQQLPMMPQSPSLRPIPAR